MRNIPVPLACLRKSSLSKKMLKNIVLIIFVLSLSLVFSSVVKAAGLSTGFSEVALENLEIGKTYSTKEKADLPLVVVNTGKEPVDLKVELLLPEASELKEGFGAIPDLGWIKLEKTEFKEMKPDEAATTDVIISIPDDRQYQGKKYQVFIWSHTAGKRIGVGLKSKLLLSIMETKETK